jgi:hypothetical protein
LLNDLFFPALGVLVIVGMLARLIHAIVVGYRDGVVRQQIRPPFAAGDYVGVRARRYGWYSVIAALLMILLILFALIPWHRFNLV